ncbi:MAG: hypothetical protein ACEQSQ_06010 [Candidatus Paceibacteria bacterium]
MKKIIILLITVIILTSCNWTTPSEDMQMLQKYYSNVYRIDAFRYICVDSIHTYDIRITNKGEVSSTIIIK